jgi:predicted RecB family nuclease
LLLIWEGQPPHGCRSLAELNAAPPRGADQEIQSRLWDLFPVIRNHVYHPRFAGSFSLEGVLPALVPEMTYDDMEVADGTDAGLAWESLLRGGLDQVERERTRKALLDYCGQDTLAMVRLLERLRFACT